MTPQQVVGLAARLFAVWLAINAVKAIGLAVAVDAQPGAHASPAPYVFAALFLVVAVLLWIFPMVVGHRLVPRTQFDDTLKTPAHDLLVVACVVLGMWLLVGGAIPQIAYYISIAAICVASGQPITTMEQSRHVNFVALIELGIGCFLILRSRRFAAYVLSQPPVAGK